MTPATDCPPCPGCGGPCGSTCPDDGRESPPDGWLRCCCCGHEWEASPADFTQACIADVAAWDSVALVHLARMRGRKQTAGRLALGFDGVTEAEIADLRAAGYCGWVSATGRMVLAKGKAPRIGGPWRCVDVLTFGGAS